jgi:hypothetical protein
VTRFPAFPIKKRIPAEGLKAPRFALRAFRRYLVRYSGQYAEIASVMTCLASCGVNCGDLAAGESAGDYVTGTLRKSPLLTDQRPRGGAYSIRVDGQLAHHGPLA